MDALSHELSGPDAADLAAASLAIARRLADGSRLWWATSPPATRVADAFVAGAASATEVRSLPLGDDFLDRLRAEVRSGDVLLLVSGSDRSSLAGLRQRAAAWGLLMVWVGDGPRPPAGAADHVLWLDSGPDGSGCAEATLSVCELLGRLTLDRLGQREWLEPDRDECTEEICITCSDEGRLGEVVALGEDGLARVRTPAGLETVDTTLIGSPAPGDLLLIHAGAALSLVPGDGS